MELWHEESWELAGRGSFGDELSMAVVLAEDDGSWLAFWRRPVSAQGAN